MKDQVALLVRTLLMYPAAGALAMFFGFMTFDAQSGFLIVDVNGASVWIAGLVWLSVSGGTFGISRIAKALGGAT